MAVKNKRYMLTVPADLEADVADIKRALFRDKTYSETYRQLIRMGLDTVKTEHRAANEHHVKCK